MSDQEKRKSIIDQLIAAQPIAREELLGLCDGFDYRPPTHHQGYPIGERGQAIGHCCGNGCIDCAFWCRDQSQRKNETK